MIKVEVKGALLMTSDIKLPALVKRPGSREIFIVTHKTDAFSKQCIWTRIGDDVGCSYEEPTTSFNAQIKDGNYIVLHNAELHVVIK